jgi:uncharacterized protein (DUF2141 family)
VEVILDGPYQTTTNTSGVYTFTGVAAGNYTLYPSAVGYTYTPLTQAISVTSNTTAPASFAGAVSPPSIYSVSGAVTGLSTSINAVLTFTTAASTVPYAQAYTGTNGAYSLGNLLPNSYTITPSATGYTFSPASAVASVTAGNVSQNFTANFIGQPHNITGAISSDPGGVTIAVTCSVCPAGFTPTTATSISGAYTVPGMLAGTYTLTPSKTGYTFSPVSTSVTMNGEADAIAATFTATANPVPTAQVSGAVSGPWAQNVTITLSSGATGATTTDKNGNYSFTLASGKSYTLTASLAGYTFSAPLQFSIPGNSSTAITNLNFTEASAITSYSISGTVHYAGTQAVGPVYLLVYNTSNSCSGSCSENGGTLITLTSGSGTYTLSGLQNGTYKVDALMDSLGTGIANAADPYGFIGSITINNTSATGADITLTDPVATTPAGLSLDGVAPGNGSAFIMYSPPTDANGIENAKTYTVSWGTDSNASNGGTPLTFKATGQNMNVKLKLVPNLTNNTQYYFKLLATNAAGTSSAYTTPVAATIGAPASNGTSTFTVSGKVTFSGPAHGPLMVLLHSPHGSGGLYYAAVQSPTSPASYIVTGVPAGDYQIAAIIDNNNDGVIDAGDYTYGLSGQAPTFAVNGATSQNVTMSSASAIPLVSTDYWYSTGSGSYGVDLGVGTGNGSLSVVNVKLISGPNVAVPFDMGIDPTFNNNSINVNLNGGTPVIGDTYGFLVTFSDGSTSIVTGSVNGVLTFDNLAQNLLFTATPSASQPTFSWSAPAVAPAQLPFMYSLLGLDLNNSIDVLSSVTSVNLSSYGKTLSPGNYYWSVQVRDAYNNSATMQPASPYVVAP